jgi:hypothetical protein
MKSCAAWTEINKNYNMDDVKNTWMRPLNLFYDFKKKLNEENMDNKLGLQYKSNNFDSIFEKVAKFALDNISFILNEMNDYIPLSMIVKVLSEKMKNTKFKEYSKTFQNMFYSNRRSEEIYKTVINLFCNYIRERKETLIIISKRGGYFESKKCCECNEPLYDSKEINNIYFKCGHIYHSFCCYIERGHFSCYICRMKELKESIYIDVPNLIFRKKEKEIKSEINEEKKISKEKERKKRVAKKNMLKKLKKIADQKKDKFEAFKTNIVNFELHEK